MEQSSTPEAVAGLVEQLQAKPQHLRLGHAVAQIYRAIGDEETSDLQIRVVGARAWADFLLTCDTAVKECERCTPKYRERVLPPFQQLFTHLIQFSAEHSLSQAASGFQSERLWLAAHAVTLELQSFRLDNSELSEITAKLDGLLNDVVAAQIDEPLRQLLIAELTRVKVAISVYHVRGPGGVETAAAHATGMLVRALVDEKSADSTSKAALVRVINTINSIVSSVQDVGVHLATLPAMAESLKLLSGN